MCGIGTFERTLNRLSVALALAARCFLNGSCSKSNKFMSSGILVRKIMPTMVLIGQYGGGAPWYLSDVSVYRAPCLCRGGALRRAALGPLAPTSLDAPVTSSPAGALRVYFP